MNEVRKYSKLLYLLVLLLAAGLSEAAITNLKTQTTAMQAVLSFVADSGACTIQVYETGSATLAHDVNPALFPGSQLDSRENLRRGDYRQFVVGQRRAMTAADGKRYSRALQAFTEHDYVITCGASVATGRFRTTNIPTGQTYMEPAPVDPARPGEYAYPDLSWVDRDQQIVDPQTGVLIKRLSLPGDYYEEFQRPLLPPTQTGTSWSNTQALLTDDTDSVLYSGTSQGWLHVPLDYTRPYYGGSQYNLQPSTNRAAVTINAWCQGASCSSASNDDRTIEMCLTIDGVGCASDKIERVLEACSSNCTGQAYRFTVGDGAPLLADWFRTTRLDAGAAFMQRRYGTVNRNGTEVIQQGGNRFSTKWVPGSPIEINGVAYTIASIDNDAALTLVSAPAGAENGVPFASATFQLMVRKKTASTHPISIQHMSWMLRESGPVYWAAGGDQDFLGNCSYTLVEGPGAELGWHCRMGTFLYWIGKDSGKVVQYGWTSFPYRDGPDGWWSAHCLESYLDKANPNVLYCAATGNSGDIIILEARYQGSHQPLVQATYGSMWECINGNSEPCWHLRNLTPSSEGRSLSQQVAAFHPDFAGFKAARTILMSQTGSSNALHFHLRRDYANNDNLSFSVVFDVATAKVIAAMPSWRYHPARWSVLHGGADIADSAHLQIPLTFFRGPFSGTDNYVGNGPYLTTVASGPITTTPTTCPARPVGSPISEAEWPVGDKCLEITVDGEPGDPTPAKYQDGTVSTQGNTVTGTGTNWTSWHNGGQMKVGNSYYTFTYVSPSQGILSPVPPVWVNEPYQLFLESVNHPKLANPDHSYLQDAEVRDIFCGVVSPQYYPGGCGLYFETEFFRLLIKNGNNWVLQRTYPSLGTFRPYIALPANAKLVAFPTACRYSITYPCPDANTYWNFRDDPFGRNETNTTILADRTGEGAGHQFFKPGLSVAAVADTCEAIDNDYYRCYNARLGDLPALLNSPNFRLTMNPAFNGRTGVGSPNEVDSHPSRPQVFERNGEPKWFLDGRPFNGGANVLASQQNPGVRLEGNLYKFVPSQSPRLRPKHMPTLALCGYNPLLDISGPSSLIGGSTTDSYRYCYADAAGECRGGSDAGDLFVNCPLIFRPYCTYAGVGGSPAEGREICVGDIGSRTETITQAAVLGQDMAGKHARVVTRGLAWHKLNDLFWNVKATPDGKWIIFRNGFAGGVRTEVLLAKLPPFPPADSVNRAEYLPLKVKVGQPASDVTNVIVEFGYNPQFHCTSRNESCVNGADSEYKYLSQPVSGVPCAGGCEVTIPAISQRILYYRLHYRNALSQIVATGPAELVATP